jgi:hypothetical protein
MKSFDLKNDYGNIMYSLECVSNYAAKRELTIGKEYNGVYFMETNAFFITNDYGGQSQMNINRFKIIKSIDMRTGQELTIK